MEDFALGLNSGFVMVTFVAVLGWLFILLVLKR